MGRRSIFRHKNPKRRVQGILSDEGFAALTLARHRLGELAQRAPDTVSDADVIEYLARGEAATRIYLMATSG